MGKTYESISASLRAFIEAQHVFFVASAPLEAEGHVNLSPKGLDSLRVLGEQTVAYADFTGSGIETVAHVRENGRIVLMFCAFEGPPRIVRIHGSAQAVEPHDPEFSGLSTCFAARLRPLMRSIIVVHAQRVGDSCGFGVPLYQYAGERSQLLDWNDKKGAEDLKAYQTEKNARSIDGLRGLRRLDDLE